MATNNSVQCPRCSAKLKLKPSKAARRRVTCPRCDHVFIIRSAKSRATADDSGSHTDHGDEQLPSPRSRRSQPRKRSGKKSGSRPTVLLLGGGGVGIIVLVAVAVLVFRSTSEDPPVLPVTQSTPDTTPATVEPPQPTASAAAEESAAAEPAPEVTSAAETDDSSPASTGSPDATPNDPDVAVTAATQPTATESEPAQPVNEAADASGPVVGRTITAFSGVAVDNTTWQSADRPEKVLVVAFMGVQCPLANLYLPRMSELQERFSRDSVAFVAINSNAQDVLQDVQEQSRNLRLTFPVLKDAGNSIADLFGAERTPELYVLDEQRTVRYHGMLDDQYGYLYRRESPTKNYVADAVAALLAGRRVTPQETPVQGCHIGRQQTAREASPLSYYRDVLPVLQQRCQRCHRDGNIGPFALNDYEEVSNWAPTIREAVTEQRMPPWKADTAHGDFVNDMSLSDQELAAIVDWVDDGCPAGDPADAPPPVEWEDDWNIGTPDRIFTMPEPIRIPATGVVPYQYVAVSEVFKRDRWIGAAECRMGNPSVVHHLLALLHYPKERNRSQDGLRGGFFAGAVPGNTYVEFSDGHAKRIPKGAQLVFQIHYTANGTETTDQSSLGVIFTDKPDYEVDTYALGTDDIHIPAGEPNYRKVSTLTIKRDVALSALMPHLHVRGKTFEYRAVFPDSTKQTLLSIPQWDFNWQHIYRFEEPVLLPKGTQLTVEATWDNSENNPSNFLPLVDVEFGEQTFDEMFIGYVNYIVPLSGPGARRSR